ncbi:hypothetical protein ES332_D01G190500v1 [Gossypium tomentosum]|uniref:Uncharacterized protein n=1 Tax=Gossypium tomentosum TaxID=34277 RepID=A0A5D2MB03_GOSTO|nr:hypothetical protein ES332_D01G190500v1 [Gossypium tomentosum]
MNSFNAEIDGQVTDIFRALSFVQLDVGLLKVLLKKQPQFLVKQLLFVFKSSTWIMGQLAQICIFSVKIIIWFCRGIH